jgi:hypothetical protein
MKKAFWIFLLLISCISKQAKTTTAASDSDFQKFISLLPKIELPYRVYCADCCKHPEILLPPELEKYKPAGSQIIGVIFNNEKYVGLLTTFAADMLIPTVSIYSNHTGELKSQKSFIGGWCDRDFDFMQKEYFNISTEGILSEIDTSYYFEMDSLSQEIIDTTKIELKAERYVVNGDGKIVEMKLDAIQK